MPDRMNRVIDRTPGRYVLLAVAIWLAAQAGYASAVHEQIETASAVNRATRDLVQSRLALESWRLERLRTLRREGFATWLEVAESACEVASLTAQQEAAEQFAGFLQNVRHRIQESARQSADDDDPPRDAVVRLSLPGSVRLVAWLPVEQATDPLAAGYAGQLRTHADAQADYADQLVDTFGSKVKSAEATFREIDRIHAGKPAAAERHQAKLELAIARAQLQLAHAMQRAAQDDYRDAVGLQRNLEAGPRQESSTALYRTAANSRPLDDRLQELTRQVAAAEAHATGAVRAAQLVVEKKALRVEAFRQLLADGHAAPHELAAAEAGWSAAKRECKQLQMRQGDLTASYRQMRRSDQEAAVPVGPVKYRAVAAQRSSGIARSIPAELPIDFPAQLLEDPHVLRHVIQLRQQRYQFAARQRSLESRRDMYAALYDKLSNIDSQTEPGRRELQRARLDVQIAGARVTAAEEMCDVLRLEELRLMRQLQWQIANGIPGEPAGNGSAGDSHLASHGLLAAYWEPTVADTGLPTAEAFTASVAARVQTVACRNLDVAFVDHFGMALCAYLPTTFTWTCDCLCAIGGDLYDVPVGAQLPPLHLLRGAAEPSPTIAGVQAVCAPGSTTGAVHYLPVWSDDVPVTADNRYSPQCVFWDTLTVPRSLTAAVGGSSRADSMRGRRLVVRPGTSIVTTPSYSSWYSFGIRNANVRTPSGIRATPYGGPWYFPGSPTNFR